MQTISHKTVYVARDGAEFDERKPAIAYERACLVREVLAGLNDPKVNEALTYFGSDVANAIVANREAVLKALNYDGRQRSDKPRKSRAEKPAPVAAAAE